MPSRVRRSLFAHIAATSIALSAGSPGAAAELASIPDDMLSDVIEDAELGAGASDTDRQRVIHWIAADSRPFIRAQAAAAAGIFFPENAGATLALLRKLAADRADVVQRAAASGLARALSRAPATERIQIVCDWTLSPESAARAAVARALASPTPMFVTDIALDCLSSDPEIDVRLSALLAIAAHFDESPAYGAIAERLTTDPDRNVRRTARTLVSMKTQC